MRNRLLVAISIAGILLAGCSSEPVATTQHECLEQGDFKYDDHCVDYNDIPEDARADIWIEVADEIAESQGISRDEAMMMIIDKFDEFQE